jgi:hypothetical protein
MELSTLAYSRRSIKENLKQKRKIKHKSKKSLGKSRKAPLDYQKEKESALDIKITEVYKHHLLYALGPNPPNPHISTPIQVSSPHIIISDI